MEWAVVAVVVVAVVVVATQVWTIRIEDEAGKLVCISRFTVAVIPLERK